jgi:GT2 family glycosyltransferase
MVRNHPALNRPAAPACSVCIANYNGAHMLGECIDSVLTQDTEATIEIIVHDDASTDGSLELLRNRYPQVEIIASEDNVGFCIGNNRMVAHARGDYVLLLNNDAALFADAIETLLAEMRAQSTAGILTLPQYDWQTGGLVDRGCLLDPFYNPVPNPDENRRDVAYVIGACLFLPRALWNELGGFPEWLGSLAEDMYLCCLARLRGIPVRVAQGSGYRHRQGASFGGNRVHAGGLHTTYRRRALSERNKTVVMMICTPTSLVWPLLALQFLALAMEGAVLTLLKRNKRLWREIYFPALRYVMRESASLRSRRRGVQGTRRSSLRDYMRGFVLLPRKLELLRRHGMPSIE